MAFPEYVKQQAKKKAAFRCCICHKLFVEVHHILPQSEGGPDTLDNAAPLCASCHDLFGGNPEKRTQIRQMRDAWWELMEKRAKQITESWDIEDISVIHEDPEAIKQLRGRAIAIYHCVFSEENFEQSAQILFSLIRETQRTHPGYKRILYLDIEGHRNSLGGFDHDMFELQRHFILGFLMPFLSEAYLPLVAVRSNRLQQNYIADSLLISQPGNMDFSKIPEEVEIDRMYVADKDKWFFSR